MKVMIDVNPTVIEAVHKAINGLVYDGDEGSAAELRLFLTNLQETIESWSDLSISEISYYAPSDKKEESVPLRKQLVFDPHIIMQVEQPGMYLAFPHTKMVQHRFAIGKDHSGVILMPYTSWMALNQIPSVDAKKSSL